MIELLLSLLGLILMAGVSFISLREIRRTRSSIPSLSDFIKKGEDGETIMREDITMVIDAFGSRIAKSLKMSFLQSMGADAKLEKGLEGAIAQDMIENKFPLLELAGDFAGFNVKKYLVKNPRAIRQLLQLAGPLLKGQNLGDLVGSPSHISPSNMKNDGVGYG